MNVKITRSQHDQLGKFKYEEYLFGSQLHGIATENSDYDYVRVISDDFYKNFTSLAKYLPNIHSWQYDGEHNTQYVWMTNTQFYNNLFSGDGNMISDIVLLSGKFENSLFLCRTYKIIKSYLGVARRDLRLHGNDKKKRFHAFRSLYMAQCLMDGDNPSVIDIQVLKKSNLPEKKYLMEKHNFLRTKLNNMLDKGQITLYPDFKEEDELVQIMSGTNNIKEFKYD